MNLKHCVEWIIGLTHLYLWCGLKRSSHLTPEIFNGDVFKPDCWFHVSILCSTFVFVLFFFFFFTWIGRRWHYWITREDRSCWTEGKRFLFQYYKKIRTKLNNDNNKEWSYLNELIL